MEYRSLSRVIILVILFFCFKITAKSQTWLPATDTLKYPKSNGGVETAGYWINKYDTIPIKYKIERDSTTHSGYRLVYKKNGFYIDDLKTYPIFFDKNRQRIRNVKEYYFR